MAKTEYSEIKSTKVNPVKEEEVTEVERPKLQPVAKATKKKKNLFQRLVLGLVGPDGIPGVASYLSKEVIIPAAKDIFVNSLNQGIQMMVYGNSSRSTPVRRGGYTNYQAPTAGQPYYKNARRASTVRTRAVSGGDAHPQDDLPYVKPRTVSEFYSDEIILDTREEAMQVLAALNKSAYEFGKVSLADFYDLVGIDGNFTDNAWGWTYTQVENDGRVVVARGGYAVLLPDLVQL